MEEAWQHFTIRSCPFQAENAAMAVWASLYRDGQAMGSEDQVSIGPLFHL